MPLALTGVLYFPMLVSDSVGLQPLLRHPKTREGDSVGVAPVPRGRGKNRGSDLGEDVRNLRILIMV